MYKFRIEKRGTRYWVLLEENMDTGSIKILDEFITKHDALKYIAKRKLSNV